jgi:hypothetical protein
MYRLIGSGDTLAPFLRIRIIGLEIGLIFILIIPFASLLGYLIGGYLFSPIYLYFHVLFFKKRVTYGISTNNYTGFKYGSEGIFSSLMAINFTLLLQSIPGLVTSVTNLSTTDPLSYIKSFAVLLMFTTLIATMLFSPSWFLTDSGILYTNEKSLNKTNRPSEIRSVGRWYGQFLKGYAGVSVILTYYEFISIFLFDVSELGILFIVLLLMFIPFPLLLIVPTIPTLIIADKIKERRIKYIYKLAKKFGITSTADISFQLNLD